MKKSVLTLLLLNISLYYVHAQKASNHNKATRAAVSPKKIIIKYGIASFYAKKFNGRKTATGDIYNSTKNTAACNVLPLNTWIKVTNLKNDKVVIVWINDRMNKKNTRLVDLSKSAAQTLGYVGRGLTRVKIEVLNNFQLAAR